MLLKRPFSKLMQSKSKRRKETVVVGKMTTEPKNTLLRGVSGASDIPCQSTTFLPEKHPEDPLLHRLPRDLYPVYRRLPLLIDISVIFLSIWVSAATTWKNLTWLQPLTALRGFNRTPRVTQLAAFLAKAVLLKLAAFAVLQDLCLPPSRVSMNTLQDQYCLPSAISEYKSIDVPSLNGTSTPIGVHYLKYPSLRKREDLHLDAVYVHHGFGASSLSWLPALPSLVDRLGARVGLGHDMMGFGFTDRQEEVDWYSTDASARISTAVLHKESEKKTSMKAIALFGHSMGAIGVLKMALQLPEETSKFIVLCSPALGISHNFPDLEEDSRSSSGMKRVILNPFAAWWNKWVFFPAASYMLKRLVGFKNFWRLGLKRAVWNDPSMVRDSDVLRYQWPAIGQSWERGILNFARAQKRLDDKALLRQVLSLRNTRVAVVHGGRDKVISSKSIKNFLECFDDSEVPMVELKELGHNPFEEDVEGFLSAVETLFERQE